MSAASARPRLASEKIPMDRAVERRPVAEAVAVEPWMLPDSDLADVPTMHHAGGKQRGTPGNSGVLKPQREHEKMAIYQGRSLVPATVS